MALFASNERKNGYTTYTDLEERPPQKKRKTTLAAVGSGIVPGLEVAEQVHEHLDAALQPPVPLHRPGRRRRGVQDVDQEREQQHRPQERRRRRRHRCCFLLVEWRRLLDGCCSVLGRRLRLEE
jgi:hypothetical protein